MYLNTTNPNSAYEINHTDDESISSFDNNVVKNVWYFIDFMKF